MVAIEDDASDASAAPAAPYKSLASLALLEQMHHALPMNIATADDHDYKLTRYDANDKPISVWVRVTHFSPAERQTRDDPGAPAEIEASGWGSFEQPLELDDDELTELVVSIENLEPDFDWDFAVPLKIYGVQR